MKRKIWYSNVATINNKIYLRFYSIMATKRIYKEVWLKTKRETLKEKTNKDVPNKFNVATLTLSVWKKNNNKFLRPF